MAALSPAAPAAQAALAALAALAVVAGACASSIPELSRCAAAARIDSGWVCGTRRRAVGGAEYASFRGVPYAKQPLGELRFQELLPPEPWRGVLDASAEGPVCPQSDVFYGRTQTASGGMGEACIHANVHVPLEALPDPTDPADPAAPGLPMLVFIHGGGFAFGSGDADLHGPEYLVSKGVIVITFNYRLNVFGFLSLESALVPGNAGLRDAVTLLGWVRRNARAWGGDPAHVTLAGQSAGAVITHMVTLTPAARGLFHRAILMSGTGFSEFFSSSPQFAKTINGLFLPLLGINASLPADQIHQKLIATPLEDIMAANKKLIDLFGLTTFVPVVESPLPGVTAVLDEDPEVSVDSGRGRHVPLLIGFTDVECESFRPRFKEIDIVAQIENLPTIVVSPRLTFRAPQTLPVLAKLIQNEYFNETADLDGFVRLCTDQYYKYPALRLAAKRAATGAPAYLYRFSYGGEHSAWKEGRGLRYAGAAHVEDLTYVFRANAVLGALQRDELARPDNDAAMKDKMTDIIVNFMRYGHPMPGPLVVSRWGPTLQPLQYKELCGPRALRMQPPTDQELHAYTFFDGLYKISKRV